MSTKIDKSVGGSPKAPVGESRTVLWPFGAGSGVRVPGTFSGDNLREDVLKVQRLLNKANGYAVVGETGVCDEGTVRAIEDFQRLWPGSTVDGKIDPVGPTLRRLDQTVTPLELKPIKLAYIRHGGYSISYSGNVLPSGYKVYLGIGDENEALDITGRDKADVIDKDNLPDLLEATDDLDLWDGDAEGPLSVECRLYVKRVRNWWKDPVVTESNAQEFPIPVKPYKGNLKDDLLEKGKVRDFTYPGNGFGRFFHPTPIDGKYYFAYSTDLFETGPAKRGFDCTTYVGTVCDLDATVGEMNADPLQLLNRLENKGKVEKADMESKTHAQVTEFFTKTKTGQFVMGRWTAAAGHVALVVDGVVHEFTDRAPAGYHDDKVDKWLKEHSGGNYTYCVRKLLIDL